MKRSKSLNTSGSKQSKKSVKFDHVLTVLPSTVVPGRNGEPPTVRAATAVRSRCHPDDPALSGKLPQSSGPKLNDIKASAFESFPKRYRDQAKRPQQSTYAGKFPETAAKLASRGFGRPTNDLVFTVEKVFDHLVPPLFNSGFLTDEEIEKVCECHGLYKVFRRAMLRYKNHDFSAIAEYNRDWATQTSIPKDRVENFLAALIHYNLDMGAVIRYAGNNYTAEYRDVDTILQEIERAVSPDILEQCRRILKQGSPTKMHGDMSRKNYEAYRKYGNEPTIEQNMEKVMKTINKEERNGNLLPFPSWVQRLIPNAHTTPQAYLIKPNKNDRLIFNGKKQPTSMVCLHQHGDQQERMSQS